MYGHYSFTHDTNINYEGEAPRRNPRIRGVTGDELLNVITVVKANGYKGPII